MAKERNKQNGKKEECPLCEISEDTLKKLKEKGQPFQEPEVKIKKKKSWKGKVLITIFVIGLITISVWKLSSNFSSQPKGETASTSEQIREEKKTNVSEISPEEGVRIGDLTPDFTSEDVYGNKISLSDFRNKKPVLLIFWATWCSFCAKELPDLKDFTEEHQNEIQVIAVDSGEPKETIKNYIQEENINFLMLLDEDRKIWNRYLVRGTPSHFLIGKDGKIVSLRPGLVSLQDLEVMLTMLK